MGYLSSLFQKKILVLQVTFGQIFWWIPNVSSMHRIALVKILGEELAWSLDFLTKSGYSFSSEFWKKSLHILDNNALSDMPSANSFLHLWLICVFCRANVFNLIKSSLTILSSVNHTLLLCACCVQKVIMSKVI